MSYEKVCDREECRAKAVFTVLELDHVQNGQYERFDACSIGHVALIRRDRQNQRKAPRGRWK